MRDVCPTQWKQDDTRAIPGLLVTQLSCPRPTRLTQIHAPTSLDGLCPVTSRRQLDPTHRGNGEYHVTHVSHNVKTAIFVAAVAVVNLQLFDGFSLSPQ